MTLDELRQTPAVLDRIDWDMTPQEAFETYQVKSPNSWRSRSLPEVYHFAVDVLRGEAKVVLIRRNLKEAEEVAELPVPPALVSAALGGGAPPHGQYPLDDAVKAWLRAALGA